MAGSRRKPRDALHIFLQGSRSLSSALTRLGGGTGGQSRARGHRPGSKLPRPIGGVRTESWHRALASGDGAEPRTRRSCPHLQRRGGLIIIPASKPQSTDPRSGSLLVCRWPSPRAWVRPICGLLPLQNTPGSASRAGVVLGAVWHAGGPRKAR